MVNVIINCGEVDWVASVWAEKGGREGEKCIVLKNLKGGELRKLFGGSEEN